MLENVEIALLCVAVLAAAALATDQDVESHHDVATGPVFPYVEAPPQTVRYRGTLTVPTVKETPKKAARRFQLPQTEPIPALEEKDLPQTLPCGFEVQYWSTSCGPILSADSRHCSSGGQLVHRASCSTHFNWGSRGCGFAMLGCQSLCSKRGLPCRPGHISFVTTHHSVTGSTEHINVLVSRQDGTDGKRIVGAGLCLDRHPDAAICAPAPGDKHRPPFCDDMRHLVQPQRLQFAHGDASPVVLKVNVRGLRNFLRLIRNATTTSTSATSTAASSTPSGGAAARGAASVHAIGDKTVGDVEGYPSAEFGVAASRTMALCLTALSSSAVIGPHGMTVIHVNSPPDVVMFTQTDYLAEEGDTVTLEVVRIGQGVGVGSVTVVVAGGTAKATADFAPVEPANRFPIKITWPDVAPSQCPAPCRQSQSVSIALRKNDIPEPDETIVLSLTAHHNLWMADASRTPQHCTITIRDPLYWAAQGPPATKGNAEHGKQSKSPTHPDGSGVDSNSGAGGGAGDGRQNVMEDSIRQRLVSHLKKQTLTDVVLEAHTYDAFLSSFEQFHLPAGTTIVEQGHRATDLFLLEQGKVEIRSSRWNALGLDLGQLRTASAGSRDQSGGGDKGKMRRVTVLEAGDLFNIVGCVYRTNSVATYRALTDVKVWMLDAESFHAVAAQHPKLLPEMERLAVQRVARTAASKPPLILVPGFMSTRLVAWKHKSCVGLGINVLDQVWLSIEKVLQTLISDAYCWLDCLKLAANETDPSDCKVRAMDGVAALSELETGLLTTGPTTIFRFLLQHFAERYGYTRAQVVPCPFDWRLSPARMHSRDGFFADVKRRIELAVQRDSSGLPGMVIAHSQGNLVFFHFMRWLEHWYPRTWKQWVDKHIHSFFGLGAPHLGSVNTVVGITYGEPMGLPISHGQLKDLGLSFGSSAWMMPNPGTGGHRRLKRTHRPRQHNTSETKQSSLSDADTCRNDSAPRRPRRRKRWALNVTRKGEEYRVKVPAQDLIPDFKWPPILSMELLNGSVLELQAADIHTGRFYQVLAEVCNDTRFTNQYHILRDGYLDTPFPHLPDGSLRPPIRHINMLYGVNVPTTVSVRFKQSVGSKGYRHARDALEPLLVTRIMEQAHGKVAPLSSGVALEDLYNSSFPSVPRSGDGTVPYVSLSWSSTWHAKANDVHVHHVPQRIIEYYENPVGQWGENTVLQLMNTKEPEYTKYSSSFFEYLPNEHSSKDGSHAPPGRGSTTGASTASSSVTSNHAPSVSPSSGARVQYHTTVYELEGIEHRNIVKEDFVQNVITQAFVRMFKDSLTALAGD